MPTKQGKKKLPFDIRKMYCQSVDIHQQITYYEMDIISEQEFVEAVRNIVKKYEAVKENSALFP